MRLIERTRELAELTAAVAGARGGSGRLVVVEGPAGIGKSSLLDACCEEAERGGAPVLRARGRELEQDASFGLAVELLAPPLAAATETERAALLAGQAGLAAPLFDPALSEPPDSQALVRGLYWLAAALAGGAAGDDEGTAAGLTIAVDDAHWADRPSLLFLAHLAARLEETPVALVVAVRSGEPAAAADVLAALRRQAAARVAPPPLSDAGVAELVAEELPAAEPEFLAACAGVAAGSPFVARELARVLRGEGVAPTAAAAAQVARFVPETVMHSLLSQLGRLGADAEAIAAALAVLGDGSPLRRVAALAGLAPEAAEAAADALAAVGLLGAGEPLRFEHPLIAAAVRADTPSFARARAQREAAALLAADGAPVGEVASHLALTTPAGDEWVLERLREAAARALAQGDAPAGARLLARAVAEPPPAERRGEVLLELAEAEALAGYTAAVGHAEEALALLDRDRDRVTALRALSRIRLASGDHELAARALEEILGGIDAEDPEEQEVLAEFLTANRFQAPLLAAARRRLEPILAAARQGSPPTDPGLLAHVALSLALAGEPAETVAPLARRAAAIDPRVDLASHGMPSGILVQALCCVDEIAVAEEVAEASLDSARRTGSFIASSVASFHRALPRYYRGELADALADLDQAQATRREGWESATAWPLSLQAHVQLERGETAAARESLAAATAPPESMDEAMLLAAQAWLALAERDHGAALKLASAAGRTLEEGFGVQSPGLVPWRRTASLAALALGDEEQARELAAEQLRRARSAAAARPLSLALRTMAASAAPAERLGLLEEAAETAAASESHLERAHSLAELGAALRRNGLRSRSQEPLREALALADRMGATALAEAALAELRASGARPRRAALSGVDALTPAERRVAQLAARGLTNREVAQELFVTAKTVQTHLSSVYRKLGIRSRRELPALLGEDERPPGPAAALSPGR